MPGRILAESMPLEVSVCHCSGIESLVILTVAPVNASAKRSRLPRISIILCNWILAVTRARDEVREEKTRERKHLRIHGLPPS